MSSTQYNISAAARITGKSRTTISKHITSGDLSVTKDKNGKTVIEASELIRVYEDSCNFAVEENRGQGSNNKSKNSKSSADNQASTAVLKNQLESEKNERNRERKQFEAEIETLKEALKLAQEGQNRVTLLLEQQSKQNTNWEDLKDNLEAKISDQQKEAQEAINDMKKASEKRDAQLLNKIQTERPKSFLKQLFG